MLNYLRNLFIERNDSLSPFTTPIQMNFPIHSFPNHIQGSESRATKHFERTWSPASGVVWIMYGFCPLLWQFLGWFIPRGGLSTVEGKGVIAANPHTPISVTSP